MSWTCRVSRPWLHIFQAAGLEALNQDGSFLRVEAVVLDDLDQGILERVAAGCTAAIGDSLGIIPGRILGLRIDGDGTPRFLALGFGDVDDFLETEYWELAVKYLRPFIGRIIGGAGDPVLQLGHGEIGDRPIIGMVFAVDDQRFQH